jgi:hypothetical protein
VSFAREARLRRAWLALEDPEGEQEAVSPLSEAQAWAVIAELMQGTKVKPDNAALIRALNLDPGKRQGRIPCPSHGQGRKPSLSWRITDDDGLLLHCFAGCTFDEIRRAVGE